MSELSVLSRLYVRARCWLHVFIAPFRRQPATEANAIARMLDWARRDGERYRAEQQRRGNSPALREPSPTKS